jgi:hypothetical protein
LEKELVQQPVVADTFPISFIAKRHPGKTLTPLKPEKEERFMMVAEFNETLN